MSDDDVRGRFVWYDLMTSDPGAAVEFYGRVIGWRTSSWEGSETPYTMWVVEDTPIGGIMHLPDDVQSPPHWIGYIDTPDVDDTTSRARTLGGQVLRAPEEIPRVGRFAILQDPQGAVFAAYTPREESSGRGETARIGEVSWHELATTDHEAALEFYGELFGWRETDSMEMGERGVYRMFGVDGTTLGGMFDQAADGADPPSWLFYIRIPDVHDGAETVRQTGGQVLEGPMEVPGGDLIVQCLDPHGAAFALHASSQNRAG